MNKVVYGVKGTYREQHIKDKDLIFYQKMNNIINIPGNILKYSTIAKFHFLKIFTSALRDELLI